MKKKATPDKEKPAPSFFDVDDLNCVDGSVDIFLGNSNRDYQVDHLVEFLSSVVDMLASGDMDRAREDCELVIGGLFKRSTLYQQSLQLYKHHGSGASQMLTGLVSGKGGDNK